MLAGVADWRNRRETEHGKQLNGHDDGMAYSAAGKGLLLEELFIAVKTTQKFHQSRMGLLLETWISQVKGQVGMRVRGRVDWSADTRMPKGRTCV